MAFLYYVDNKGEWRWRLQAPNNRILADSGEGYQNKSDCLEAIALIKKSAPDAVVSGP